MAETKTIHVGGEKMEEKENIDVAARNNLGWNAFGIQPTAKIFTLTSGKITEYFSKFFEDHGYANIRFVATKPAHGVTPMYLVFPKNRDLLSNGKSQNDREVALLGGRSHGAHIRLDGKLHELIRPFVSDKNVYVETVKSNSKYAFIRLDPACVLAILFGQNRQYEVVLVDVAREGSSTVYRVAKQLRPMNDAETDLADIVKGFGQA